MSWAGAPQALFSLLWNPVDWINSLKKKVFQHFKKKIVKLSFAFKQDIIIDKSKLKSICNSANTSKTCIMLYGKQKKKKETPQEGFPD